MGVERWIPILICVHQRETPLNTQEEFGMFYQSRQMQKSIRIVPIVTERIGVHFTWNVISSHNESLGLGMSFLIELSTSNMPLFRTIPLLGRPTIWYGHNVWIMLIVSDQHLYSSVSQQILLCKCNWLETNQELHLLWGKSWEPLMPCWCLSRRLLKSTRLNCILQKNRTEAGISELGIKAFTFLTQKKVPERLRFF